MKNDRNSETNAAPTVVGAGRELITSVLQRNPIVAVATALIGPILGLFRRRRPTTATHVEKLKLERYSSQPMSPPPGKRRRKPSSSPDTSPTASRSHPEGNPMPTRRAQVAVKSPLSRAQVAPQSGTRTTADSALGSNLNHGGHYHG